MGHYQLVSALGAAGRAGDAHSLIAHALMLLGLLALACAAALILRRSS